MAMLIEEQQQTQLNLFADCLPKKPYCTNELEWGLKIGYAKTALKKRYIQHNKHTEVKWLAFDCDYANAIEIAEERNLPAPNLAMLNPRNGHSHLLYGLEVPVHRTHMARAKPLLYLAKVEHSLRTALDADIGYAGLIVKNPHHKEWMTYELRQHSYDLPELADYLTLPDKLPKKAQTAGLGRNCTLFEVLRKWAYAEVLKFRLTSRFDAFADAVMCQAIAFNNFPKPLPWSEVRSTAKSISKWCWNHYTGRMDDADFSALQAHRQGLQVISRVRTNQPLIEQANALYEAGQTQQQIADQLGKSQKTICNWLRGYGK